MPIVVTIKEVLDDLAPFKLGEETLGTDEVLGKYRVRVSGISYQEDDVIRLHEKKTPVIVGNEKYEYIADPDGEIDRTENAVKHLEEFGRTLVQEKKIKKEEPKEDPVE